MSRMSGTTIDWARELPVAITVTDARGSIVEMNAAAAATFASHGGAALVGQDLRACHPPAARERLEALFREERAHHYTIRKHGQRKIIHQLPWYEGGRFAGLIELSIPIPDELPHFDRDAAPKRT
jgi:transcriptional regulator with PAS, ATPase and Fis domain